MRAGARCQGPAHKAEEGPCGRAAPSPVVAQDSCAADTWLARSGSLVLTPSGVWVAKRGCRATGSVICSSAHLFGAKVAMPVLGRSLSVLTSPGAEVAKSRCPVVGQVSGGGAEPAPVASLEILTPSGTEMAKFSSGGYFGTGSNPAPGANPGGAQAGRSRGRQQLPARTAPPRTRADAQASRVPAAHAP